MVRRLTFCRGRLSFGRKTALVLALSLMLSMVAALPAYAFSDVKEDAWYYDYVSFMQTSGISTGYPDGTYRPEHPVSGAESLVFMLKALQIPVEDAAVPPGSHWAYHYIRTPQAQGALPVSFAPDQPVKRAEAARIMYNLMELTSEDALASPFADINSPEVTKLFQLGIFSGSFEDGKQIFKPDNRLTRAELSTIIKKLYDYNAGGLPEAETQTGPVTPARTGAKASTPAAVQPPVREEFILTPILKDGEAMVVKYPQSVADFEKLLLYMAKENQYTQTINYTAKYTESFKNNTIPDNLKAAFHNVFVKYPEYCCYTTGLEIKGSYGPVNKLTVNLTNEDFSAAELTGMRTAFFIGAEAFVKDMAKEGKLTNDMTETQKARAIYEWTAYYLQYDVSQQRESFTGYGAIKNRKAVCQGYTALYNAMCKLAGIKDVRGIEGTAVGSRGGKAEDHIWTLATLDAKTVHIDATFGDPLPDRPGVCHFDYFAVGSDFMRKDHTWDEDKYKL